ncbi:MULTISPECIES: DUF4870 family protein [Ralstonia]|uniref:Predicted membrane protein n=1 Tax=Ralstonia mannitolilytica TaxID=105219 RepID=A0AAJ4ZQW4_9RALS|nr:MULTISPECIES: membrane protein [Ralstonia]AJW46150.1 membrane protein [Ralstonia mannitolilytica]MBU9580792.1 hypothetical protein [Ralstonia mannitolilytica]PLT20585.1 hypothetical protein CXP34_10140 [Ralstonia mannitolilytica]QIF08579.1 hypothetical protein G5A69_13630 [Ralstonia mannitolilytica]CAG2148797.1 hypothetical protein LMG6866_03554 [Ralstonia mannitolilytica]
MDKYGAAMVVTDDAERLAGLQRLTHILYALYAIFWLTGGVTALIAIIIDYVKRDDVRGTLYESHFRWQIRSFWWCVLWGLVGVVLIPLAFIGFAVLWVLGIWMLYRIVKGWLYLNDSKPMYANQ